MPGRPHPDAHELLDLALGQITDPMRKLEVVRHLEGCRPCESAFQRENALLERLRQLGGEDAPHHLGLLSAARIASEHPVPSVRLRAAGISGSAVAVLVIILIVLFTPASLSERPLDKMEGVTSRAPLSTPRPGLRTERLEDALSLQDFEGAFAFADAREPHQVVQDTVHMVAMLAAHEERHPEVKAAIRRAAHFLQRASHRPEIGAATRTLCQRTLRQLELTMEKNDRSGVRSWAWLPGDHHFRQRPRVRWLLGEDHRLSATFDPRM